jgi:hypothetical protein
VLDLEVEIESLSGDMSTRIKQYQVVKLGSPQRSRRLEAISRININAVPSQDAGAHVASALVGGDEKNFLVIESRATKWWWLVHPAPTKLTRLSAKGNIGSDSLPGRRGKSREMEKPRVASRGFFLLRFVLNCSRRVKAALSKSEQLTQCSPSSNPWCSSDTRE